VTDKTQMYDEHLDMEAYTELTEGEANEMNAETKRLIRKIFNAQCGLTKVELTYLGRSFKQLQKGSTSYMVAQKLH
jgi:hypothetical protein